MLNRKKIKGLNHVLRKTSTLTNLYIFLPYKVLTIIFSRLFNDFEETFIAVTPVRKIVKNALKAFKNMHFFI